MLLKEIEMYKLMIKDCEQAISDREELINQGEKLGIVKIEEEILPIEENMV